MAAAANSLPLTRRFSIPAADPSQFIQTHLTPAPDLRRSYDRENETWQMINSIDSTMDRPLICGLTPTLTLWPMIMGRSNCCETSSVDLSATTMRRRLWRPCNNQFTIIKCDDHATINLWSLNATTTHQLNCNDHNDHACDDHATIKSILWLRWLRDDCNDHATIASMFHLTWLRPWSWLKRQQLTRHDRKQSTFIRRSFWFWRRRQSPVQRPAHQRPYKLWQPKQHHCWQHHPHHLTVESDPKWLRCLCTT